MDDFILKHIVINNLNKSCNSQKNLLFSSIGDNFDYTKWNDKNKNYDIVYVYYGNNNNKFNIYKNNCNFIIKHKGSKFQNLYYFYVNYKFVLNNYDYIFVLDDDILISPNDINTMFHISKKYNLFISGPSFKHSSNNKISWKININKPNNTLRFTNFVEVNTPLFKKTCLFNYLKYHNNDLLGWGIDFLYHMFNGMYKNKYAIIDLVQCINPINKNELLKNHKNYINRKKIFENYCNKYNIKLTYYNKFPYEPKVYSFIK